MAGFCPGARGAGRAEQEVQEALPPPSYSLQATADKEFYHRVCCGSWWEDQSPGSHAWAWAAVQWFQSIGSWLEKQSEDPTAHSMKAGKEERVGQKWQRRRVQERGLCAHPISASSTGKANPTWFPIPQLPPGALLMWN